jgi:aerobic carbon-monoxide dehydrogenase medium subunit
MKPAPFDYVRPSNSAEAVAALAAHGNDGKAIAGGQSLVAAMNFRLARPAVLVDLNGASDLDYLRVDGGLLRIGALTRHAAFHRPVADGPLGRLLSLVVHHIAHYPIRQRGTFTGSLAHADPASEWCLVARTLDAEMVIANAGGKRICGAADFFKGTFTTAIRPDDLLTEARLPLLGLNWHFGFSEFSRRAGDFALAMSLAAIEIKGGVIRAARLGVGGVADRPLRLDSLEGELIGQRPSAELIAGIGDAARDLITPTADIHASTDFRRDLIRTVVIRALTQAAA